MEADTLALIERSCGSEANVEKSTPGQVIQGILRDRAKFRDKIIRRNSIFRREAVCQLQPHIEITPDTFEQNLLTNKGKNQVEDPGLQESPQLKELPVSSTEEGTGNYTLRVPQSYGDFGVTKTSTAPVNITPDTRARDKTIQPGNETIPTIQRFKHHNRTSTIGQALGGNQTLIPFVPPNNMTIR